jgi:hypothetical protein
MPARVWRPTLQPVSHPKKQQSFLGDPGLETGATRFTPRRSRSYARAVDLSGFAPRSRFQGIDRPSSRVPVPNWNGLRMHILSH